MLQLWIVRHCEAEGQAPDASLTARGREQAARLADFFAGVMVHCVVSSPFRRAMQSVEPLCIQRGLDVRTEPRFAERVLSTDQFTDWRDRLRATFDDLDLTYVGGESSRQAMKRAVEAVESLAASTTDETVNKDRPKSVVLVTHGNLLTLLLKHFDHRFGFTDWEKLTNPDVFQVTLAQDKAEIRHAWA